MLNIVNPDEERELFEEFYAHDEPFERGFLPVSSLHTIHYAEFGNPDGQPVVVVHGGPGAEIDSDEQAYFDWKHYRMIMIDQRGCGASTPRAEIKENTTQDLVEDMEKVRVFLGIERWIVFGGSWGSLLSLVYAITHPEVVEGLIVYSVCLGNAEENKWCYQEGASKIFPDYWEDYIELIPEHERDDLLSAYYKRLTSKHEKVALEAARRFERWEYMLIGLVPDPDGLVEDDSAPLEALTYSKIMAHYFVNNAFLKEENFILKQIHRLKGIPCHFVQGRFDMICPVEHVWSLYKAFPEATLHIIECESHCIETPEGIDTLIRITEGMKRRHP